jgi:hypothetical protein
MIILPCSFYGCKKPASWGHEMPMPLRASPHRDFTLHTFISVIYAKVSLCFWFSGQTWYGWHQLLIFRVLHGTTNKQVGFPCDEWFHVKTDTVIHTDWGAADLVFQVLYEQIWLIPWRLCIYVLVIYWLENMLGIVKGAVMGISFFFFFFIFLILNIWPNLTPQKSKLNQIYTRKTKIS